MTALCLDKLARTQKWEHQSYCTNTEIFIVHRKNISILSTAKIHLGKLWQPTRNCSVYHIFVYYVFGTLFWKQVSSCFLSFVKAQIYNEKSCQLQPRLPQQRKRAKPSPELRQPCLLLEGQGRKPGSALRANEPGKEQIFAYQHLWDSSPNLCAYTDTSSGRKWGQSWIQPTEF